MNHEVLPPSEQINTSTKTKTQLPRLYKVVLINDDFTPMDFVVLVLIKFFSFTSQKAVEVMYEVHLKGKGECGIYSKDIAETKMLQVNGFARDNKHPLLCEIEECAD